MGKCVHVSDLIPWTVIVLLSAAQACKEPTYTYYKWIYCMWSGVYTLSLYSHTICSLSCPHYWNCFLGIWEKSLAEAQIDVCLSACMCVCECSVKLLKAYLALHTGGCVVIFFFISSSVVSCHFSFISTYIWGNNSSFCL